MDADNRSAGGETPLPWLSRGFRARLVAFIQRGRPNSSRLDVEDAVQDVFLRIHELVSSRAPPATPRDWDRYMYQAVSNRLNDMHRTRRRQTGLPAESLDACPAEDSDQPDASAEIVERAALFQMLLGLIRGDSVDHSRCDATGRAFMAVQRDLRSQLQDRHWIVLRMRGLEVMGFKEIAAAMGVSLGSVHGWYQSALKICAAVLRRHDIDLEIP
jgi:RNA polymerase sigma factor (sigma-70 family)